MKNWLNKFLCLHFWIKGLPTDIEWGRGYKYAYDCVICKKRIERWSGNEPISGAKDPLYKEGDLYHISPPVVYIDRGKF